MRLRSLDARARESETEEEGRKIAGKKLDKLQISLQRKEAETTKAAKKPSKKETAQPTLQNAPNYKV